MLLQRNDRIALPALVGVICSPADLRNALELPTPPDFFEVRLDAMAPRLEALGDDIGKLAAPLILTVRHPAEGGRNRLSLRDRRALFFRFLARATYVDVELRSVRHLAPLVRKARARAVGIIISFHDLKGTPTLARLEKVVCAANSLGADVLKIATRTDNLEQLTRLREVLLRHRHRGRITVLGIGRLGRRSRSEFAALGCALAYGHLGKSGVAGQPSLEELRRMPAKPPRAALPIRPFVQPD